MNIKAYLSLLCLLIGINSLVKHELDSIDKSSLITDVEVTHTSNRQFVKISESKSLELLTVPDAYQFYQHSSGQCCLQAIFNYYQFPISPSPYRQDFFVNANDRDADDFTTPQKLIQAAQRKLNNQTNDTRKNAFGFILQENMQFSVLQRALSLQIPVILLISKGQGKIGSYVIAIGSDQTNYYFEDPQTLGSIAFIAKKDLSRYWQMGESIRHHHSIEGQQKERYSSNNQTTPLIKSTYKHIILIIIMKLIFLIGVAIICCLTERVIPPTLPEFENANLTRKQGLYQIVTDRRTINLINIPDVFQPTSYSCGPSSLRAVLNYHDLEFRESQIMKAAGTIPNKGTGPIMLETGFHKLINSTQRDLQSVISFYRKQNMTVEELEKNINDGNPVIVLIQNFKAPENTTPYTQYNDGGHYIVAIGMDDERYYFQNPTLYNTIVYINKSEFEDRWHDYLNTEGRFAVKVGIIVSFKDGHQPQGKQTLQPLIL